MKQPAEAMPKLCEEQRRDAEPCTGHRDLHHQPCVEWQRAIRRGDSHGIGGQVEPPEGSHEVSSQGGVEHRQECAVLQPADRDDLHPEDCPGNRRPEDRAEAGCDTGHQQCPEVVLFEAEEPVEGRSDAAAHLHRRTFAPDRCPGEV